MDTDSMTIEVKGQFLTDLRAITIDALHEYASELEEGGRVGGWEL